MTSSDTHDITNADRAECCHAALERYNDEYDVRSNLIDLLADARHWCIVQRISYAEIDRIAHQHYVSECDGDKRGQP